MKVVRSLGYGIELRMALISISFFRKYLSHPKTPLSVKISKWFKRSILLMNPVYCMVYVLYVVAGWGASMQSVLTDSCHCCSVLSLVGGIYG